MLNKLRENKVIRWILRYKFLLMAIVSLVNIAFLPFFEPMLLQLPLVFLFFLMVISIGMLVAVIRRKVYSVEIWAIIGVVVFGIVLMLKIFTILFSRIISVSYISVVHLVISGIMECVLLLNFIFTLAALKKCDISELMIVEYGKRKSLTAAQRKWIKRIKYCAFGVILFVAITDNTGIYKHLWNVIAASYDDSFVNKDWYCGAEGENIRFTKIGIASTCCCADCGRDYFTYSYDDKKQEISLFYDNEEHSYQVLECDEYHLLLGDNERCTVINLTATEYDHDNVSIVRQACDNLLDNYSGYYSITGVDEETITLSLLNDDDTVDRKTERIYRMSSYIDIKVADIVKVPGADRRNEYEYSVRYISVSEALEQGMDKALIKYSYEDYSGKDIYFDIDQILFLNVIEEDG